MRPVTGWVGVGLVIVFLVAERALRRGQAARTWTASPSDRNTTRAIVLSFLVTGFGAPLLALPSGRLPMAVGLAGLGVMLAGLAFRVWAAVVLGLFYTRTLRVLEDHELITAGPYAIIRHPGYLGSMMLWVGYSLAWVNAISLIVLIAIVAAYWYRIQTEERMLLFSLGEGYQEYRRRTWRLIPFVW